MGQNPLGFFAQTFGATTGAGGTIGPKGDLFISERHNANYGPSAYGSAFWGANQAGVTTSAGLATTYVGICLSNPAGSGKVLAVTNVSGYLNVAPAAIIGIGLISGYSAAGIVTHTTPLTVYNEQVGAGAGAAVGLLDAACTLVGASTYVPAWREWLTVPATPTGEGSFTKDIAGRIQIIPGSYLAIGTSVAGPASGFFGSIAWEEN